MQTHSNTISEPLMPMTPQQQVQMQVRSELIPKIAELLYQADKGSKHARIGDLRSEEARAVYIADAMMLTDQRAERVLRVQVADAHHFALQDKEGEDVALQARKDIAHFGPVRPGHCYVCRERIVTDASTLLLSASLKADVHGMCCAKDEQRFELAADFSYRLIGGGK